VCFKWIDYAQDSLFKTICETGCDYNMFSTLKNHLKIQSSYSMPAVFGLTCEEIILSLQALVSKTFPNVFLEDQRQLRAASKINQIIRSTKRKTETIQVGI
jgi:hypothetical protein